jgi:PAS domain S-box-containing protein
VKEMEGKLVAASLRSVQNESMAGLGSWLWNLTTGEIEWSDNLYEMAGYKPNAIKGTDKVFLRSVHPDDQKVFKQQVELTAREKLENNFHFRIIKKTGIRHVRAYFRVMQHEGEEMFVATFQDITTEFSGKAELNERIQLIETLSDSIPDIVIVTNTDNSIVHWNSRCEEVYNRKKEDVIGENFFDVFPHLKGEAMITDVNTALKGQVVELKEYHTNRQNKGIYNIKLIPLKDETDNVIGVLHMLHDITREHHLHQELTGRLQFIERLLEATVDRIIVLDRNMNYLYWNKRAEDYYGISKEEVVGKNILDTFPAFMNDPSYKEFRNVLKGDIVHIPAEKNLHNKKGYFETYLIPVKTKEGTVSSILWITHDLYKEFQLQRQKLKEHEVLDALNENYLELDADYLVTYINQKGEEFLGRSKEDIIGNRIWDVFPEAARSPVRDAMKKAMEEGVSTRDEYLSSSTGVWINISIAPTIDGIVMLFFDIQHIKESQDKLQEEHRRLQEAQSIGHIGSFDWDAHSDSISWSAEMFRINGLEPVKKNITLEEALSRVHPNDYQEVKELILTARSKAGIYNIEHRVLRPNGEVRIVDRRMRSFQNDQGVVTFLTGTVQDITERVEAQMNLVEMQKRLQQIAEASPDAITIYDVVNRSPEYINNNLGIWTGYTSEELVAMGYEGRLELIFPADRPKIEEFNQTISHVTETDVRSYEYRIITRKGDIIWVRNRSKIFERNEAGQVTHILSVLQEITKEKAAHNEVEHLNRSLETRNKELEEKNEEIGHFAFVASHDLKEPLRKIHTYSDWLVNNEKDQISAAGKKNLEKIGVSVKKMEMLLEDILILTRMNGYEAPPTQVNLNDTLEAAKEDLVSCIKESGAEIRSDSLPVIKGHERQLHQLTKNLLQNAIKFCMPGSHPQVTVTTSTVKGSEVNEKNARPEINYVTISFADKGMGIEEKYKKKVFQMFQKLHTKSDADSTGAGLFICKKVMENHDGFISFSSEPGKGSVFTCYFPLS